MQWSNEELVGYADEALDGIESAISELSNIEEYKNITEQLKEIKSELEELKEPYEEALGIEYDEEERRANAEYERGVI